MTFLSYYSCNVSYLAWPDPRPRQLRKTVTPFETESFEANTNRRLSTIETKIDKIIDTFSVSEVSGISKGVGRGE